MKILVDADSCPVKDIIYSVSKKYNISSLFFINTNHVSSIKNNESYIIVDDYSQSVDIKIANKMQKGDIVVTNDYGLASLVLSKRCLGISFNGHLYNKETIDNLVMKRHLVMKQKNNKKLKIKGPRKRKKRDDVVFKSNLISLIEKNK